MSKNSSRLAVALELACVERYREGWPRSESDGDGSSVYLKFIGKRCAYHASSPLTQYQSKLSLLTSFKEKARNSKLVKPNVPSLSRSRPTWQGFPRNQVESRDLLPCNLSAKDCFSLTLPRRWLKPIVVASHQTRRFQYCALGACVVYSRVGS